MHRGREKDEDADATPAEQLRHVPRRLSPKVGPSARLSHGFAGDCRPAVGYLEMVALAELAEHPQKLSAKRDEGSRFLVFLLL